MSFSAASSVPYQYQLGYNFGLSCNALTNSEAPTTIDHQWSSSPPFFEATVSDALSPRSSSPEVDELHLGNDRDEAPPEQDSSKPSRAKKIRMPQRKGGMQLWQFLYALLQDAQKTYAELIEWTGNRAELEFRLLEPEAVAAWWGNIRHKPTMNYEKLSRSLRYYYDKGILKKMGGERYLYRFCVDPEEMYRHIGNSDSRPGLKPMPLAAKQCMSKYTALAHHQHASFFPFGSPDPLQLPAPPELGWLQNSLLHTPPPPYPFDIPPALNHSPWDYPASSFDGQLQPRKRFNSWEDCREAESLPQTLPTHVMPPGIGQLQERSFSTNDLPHLQPMAVMDMDLSYPPHPSYSPLSHLPSVTCSGSSRSPSFSTGSEPSCDADLAELLSITGTMEDNTTTSLPSNLYTTTDDLFFTCTFTENCRTSSIAWPPSSKTYGNLSQWPHS